jgi:hypothetical protein
MKDPMYNNGTGLYSFKALRNKEKKLRNIKKAILTVSDLYIITVFQENDGTLIINIEFYSIFLNRFRNYLASREELHAEVMQDLFLVRKYISKYGFGQAARVSIA